MPTVSARRAASPPPIGITRRVKTRELKPCKNPSCSNYHYNKSCCSRDCQRMVVSKLMSDKKRGSNPKTHIRILIDGKRRQLSHVMIERAIGRPLNPFEVVHHFDDNKHHNCTWIEHCGCGGNLVLCPDQEFHMRIHRERDAETLINTSEYF